MSFWNIFSFKKKKPTPAAEKVVGLVDIVKQQIDKLVNDIVWSGDTTFSSRDDVVDFISEVVDGMKIERVLVGTSTNPPVENKSSVDIEQPFSKEVEEIPVPKKVVRTRLKPLTLAKKTDTVQ